MTSLGSLQELFVKLEAEWVLWVLSHPGWTLRHGEGRILQMGPDGKGRKVKHALTGLPLRVKDAVHMDKSAHYNGLAADWNLFVDGVWISNGDHPAWKACGAYWLSLHGLARHGGEWGDANHISVEYGGVK